MVNSHIQLNAGMMRGFANKEELGRESVFYLDKNYENKIASFVKVVKEFQNYEKEKLVIRSSDQELVKEFCWLLLSRSNLARKYVNETSLTASILGMASPDIVIDSFLRNRNSNIFKDHGVTLLRNTMFLNQIIIICMNLLPSCRHIFMSHHSL